MLQFAEVKYIQNGFIQNKRSESSVPLPYYCIILCYHGEMRQLFK